MGRRPRWVPEEGFLINVSCRTIQGRFLLRPSPELNELVVGVLGHAQGLTSMPICGVSVLSSHFHLLLDVVDAGQLSRFMLSVDGGHSYEVGRLVNWPRTMWDRRFSAIVVNDEEAAQVASLRYVLARREI